MICSELTKYTLNCLFLNGNSHCWAVCVCSLYPRTHTHPTGEQAQSEASLSHFANCCRVVAQLQASLQTSMPEQWDHEPWERWHNEIWRSQPQHRLHMFHISNSQNLWSKPQQPFSHSALVAYDNLSVALCALAAERRWEVLCLWKSVSSSAAGDTWRGVSEPSPGERRSSGLAVETINPLWWNDNKRKRIEIVCFWKNPNQSCEWQLISSVTITSHNVPQHNDDLLWLNVRYERRLTNERTANDVL